MLPKHKRPKVAIVTLSWNAREDVRKMLRCVRKQTQKPDRVIVVDSGSTDGTVEMIRKEFPSIEIHDLKKNIGYAAGYNIAFRLVPANIEYVVVLDQDVIIKNDYVEKVVVRFDKEPESTAILMCDLEEPLIKTFALEEGYVKAYHGSCFSYRNKYKKHMIYDEKMWAYNNEADLCSHLLLKGFKILYYPGCKTFHKKDSTVMNSFRVYYMTRNAMWHWWKNASLVDAILGSFLTMGIFYSKASKYRALPAYFRAVFDAFAGLPYCLRNRIVNKELSYKDLDDAKKIIHVSQKTGTYQILKFFDRLYESSKR